MIEEHKESVRQCYIISQHGKELPELKGKFYNCIFDEGAGRYDNSKPHQHKVIEAWMINLENSIYNGIAFLSVGGYKLGCALEDFKA